MCDSGPIQHLRESQASQPTKFSANTICRLVWYSAILFCCISLVGCGPKLAISRDVDLAPGEIKSIIIAAIGSEQTVNVEASSEEPFHLHLYLLENEAALDSELDRRAEPTMALAGSKDSKSHKVSASIPGGKEAAVRLQSATGQAFSVKLKITN